MNTYRTQEMVMGRYIRDAMLSALKTRPGAALAAGLKCRLSQDPTFNPVVGDTPATLVAGECDFSGYAAGGVAVTLSDPVHLDPSTEGVLATATFVAVEDSPFVGNTVYGYWLDDGTGVTGGERFASGAAIEIGEPGDFAEIIVQIPLEGTQTAP